MNTKKYFFNVSSDVQRVVMTEIECCFSNAKIVRKFRKSKVAVYPQDFSKERSSRNFCFPKQWYE